MKWYEELTCEELLKTIMELKKELDNRSINPSQKFDFEEEGKIAIISMFARTTYELFPEIDEIYVE